MTQCALGRNNYNAGTLKVISNLLFVFHFYLWSYHGPSFDKHKHLIYKIMNKWNRYYHFIQLLLYCGSYGFGWFRSTRNANMGGLTHVLIFFYLDLYIQSHLPRIKNASTSYVHPTTCKYICPWPTCGRVSSAVPTVLNGLFPAWWRHQMETFSTLLALCAVNSTVTG